MKFRPCIDIHNGKVKQIVGGTLRDEGDAAAENFVSERSAADFARFYAADDLRGGHVILLNPASSEHYEATKRQALSALSAWPGGLMLGGGIRPETAEEFLNAGASHVIVTSYVFSGGRINEENLERMIAAVGKEHLVLDLSCRRKDDAYYIVTDRWQKYTQTPLTAETLNRLAACCDEFLIHAVDAEGMRQGVEEDVLRLLGDFTEIPVTYAGGVGSFSDLDRVKRLGKDHVDVTIGSALDIFGGDMPYREVLKRV